LVEIKFGLIILVWEIREAGWLADAGALPSCYAGGQSGGSRNC
jgi:hypothetical protein